MRYVRYKRGFTLVELIIVIAIMGVVFTAASSFLLTNLKTFHRADDQIDAQYNAQIAMNEIIDNIMESEGIVSINQNLGAYIGDPIDISEIIFKIDDNKYIKYAYNSLTKELSRGQDSTQGSIDTELYASSIEAFKAELIIDSGVTDYNKSKGIIITIKTTIKDSNIELTNQVYFRNAPN